MSETANVSVIVPAYNRIENLKAVLAGLKEQTVQNFEIIVVDDGSSEDIKAAIPAEATYIRRPDVGYGVAAARNDGAKAARGTYLLFFDQDVVPASGYIEELMKTFKKFEGKHIAIGGYLTGYYGSNQDPRTPFGVWNNPMVLTDHWRHLNGGNFALLAEDYEICGGYDGNMTFMFNDVVFGWRLKVGVPEIKFVLNPAMKAAHLPHPPDATRSRSRQISRDYIKATYPEAFEMLQSSNIPL